MVAGGICSRGKTELIIIHQVVKINGQYYRENILPVYFEFMQNKEFFPNQRIVTFLQDGALPHSAEQSLNLIKKDMPNINIWCKGIYPGNSCDFNVIEHIWNTLQESVFLEPGPTNRNELITRIKSTWDSLDVQYLCKLTESFPSRISEASAADGGHTSY